MVPLNSEKFLNVFPREYTASSHSLIFFRFSEGSTASAHAHERRGWQPLLPYTLSHVHGRFDLLHVLLNGLRKKERLLVVRSLCLAS